MSYTRKGRRAPDTAAILRECVPWDPRAPRSGPWRQPPGASTVVSVRRCTTGRRRAVLLRSRGPASTWASAATPCCALTPRPERVEGHLALFLSQYWGGPTTYNEERGHPRLRMRHAPFVIGPLERDAWLRHMATPCGCGPRRRRRRGVALLLRDGGRLPHETRAERRCSIGETREALVTASPHRSSKFLVVSPTKQLAQPSASMCVFEARASSEAHSEAFGELDASLAEAGDCARRCRSRWRGAGRRRRRGSPGDACGLLGVDISTVNMISAARALP